MRVLRLTVPLGSILLLCALSSCQRDNSPTPQGALTDQDGNSYTTVKIGTQTWMAQNLKATHYRNGDAIPNLTDQATWGAATSGAYCELSNDVSSATTYGRLYNWYAVNDSRNLAPTGWHVATDAEWTTLSNLLGGETLAGGKLKEAGTTHWCDPNVATNTFGFIALPGGARSNVLFLTGCGYGMWWSATESTSTTAFNRVASNNDATLNRVDNEKEFGMSVRCVKD